MGEDQTRGRTDLSLTNIERGERKGQGGRKQDLKPIGRTNGGQNREWTSGGLTYHGTGVQYLGGKN